MLDYRNTQNEDKIQLLLVAFLGSSKCQNNFKLKLF